MAYGCESNTFHSIVRKYYTNLDICTLQKQSLMDQPVYFLLLKKSQYTQMFRSALIQFDEHGHLTRMKSFYDVTMPSCMQKNTVYSIEMSEIKSAFFVLKLASLLSLIILVIEIFSYRIGFKKLLKFFFQRLSKQGSIFNNKTQNNKAVKKK